MQNRNLENEVNEISYINVWRALGIIGTGFFAYLTYDAFQEGTTYWPQLGLSIVGLEKTVRLWSRRSNNKVMEFYSSIPRRIKNVYTNL